MYSMGNTVIGRPVQKTVHPIEMKTLPEQDYPKKQDEPDRVVAELKRRRQPGINSAEIDHFVERPDRHTPGYGPEHVVQHLIAKRESAVVPHHFAAVEFQLITLPAHDPEPQMQPTSYDRN